MPRAKPCRRAPITGGPDGALRRRVRQRSIGRLARRRRDAGGLVGERAALLDRRPEIEIAVAERDPALADRHTAVGFAIDAAIDGDRPITRAFDLDLAVYQHLAAAVHGDEIGRAVALAGDHDDAAALQA